MAEARLSFEERKTIFPFLKCVYIFLAPSVYVCICSYIILERDLDEIFPVKNLVLISKTVAVLL